MIITLPNTRLTVVLDDIDKELVKSWNWTLADRRWTMYVIGSKWNSITHRPINILMHRLILDAPQGIKVDHINRNGLDNRRSNLRLATDIQSSAHRGMRTDNSSGYKGVIAANDRWRARVAQTHIGYFASSKEAAYAYDRAAIQLYGEFALTNEQLGLLPPFVVDIGSGDSWGSVS